MGGNGKNKTMQLHLSSWPEIEAYLAKSKAILIPIGSTEQHGPNGLLGTDALCPEIIGRRAGDEGGILVGPTFNVGQAQHHMAFTGTITLRPSTMIAAMLDWAQSLAHHGFERLYWLNGHGGNIATINAAFSEIYHGVTFGKDQKPGSNHPPVRCMLRNWWELQGVGELCRQLFPVGEGSHADAVGSLRHLFRLSRSAEARGDDAPHRADGADLRCGRLSSPFSRRPHRLGSFAGERRSGAKIVAAAVKSLITEFRHFAET